MTVSNDKIRNHNLSHSSGSSRQMREQCCKRYGFYLLICILFCTHTAHAQYENVWIFGGQDTTGAGIDFTNNSATPIRSAINGWGEAAASVCDENGKLLFYTEGSFVWDRNHNLMPNGDSLTGVPFSHGYSPTSSTTQGVLIIPMPGTKHLYYVFSLVAMENEQNAGRLYCSVVDMSLNNGWGDVMADKKGILLDTFLTEKMSAVIGDRCNIWLMVCAKNEKFRAFEITENGISNTPVESSVGLGSAERPIGCMTFSPDRRKIAATQTVNNLNLYRNGCAIFDFDPVTGLVTNPIQLLAPTAAYGVCFSPDNKKLFVSAQSPSTLYQYDLSSGIRDSIIASAKLIGSGGFRQMKIGPDNKIYISDDHNAEQSLGIIHEPNLSGTAVNYERLALRLLPGTNMHGGLPNVVPVFKRDTVYTSRTDTVSCFTGSRTLLAVDISGWDYVWSTIATTTAIEIYTSGTYWVSYRTAPCVKHTDTFNVWFPSGSLPVMHTTEAVCKDAADGMARMEATAGDTTTYHYVWRNDRDSVLSLTDSVGHLSSGNYTVQVTTSSGCDTTIAFAIPEVSFQASFSTSDTLICIGDTVFFRNTSPSHFNDFYWSFGNGNTSSLQNPVYTFTDSGQQEIMLVARGAICIDTAYATITIDQPLERYTFDTDRREICTGEQIIFTPLKEQTVFNLHWLMGDGNSFTTRVEDIQHAYDADGTFPVIVTAQFRACPDLSAIDSVTVYPHPTVDLGRDSVICLNGTSLALQNCLPNLDGYRYLWNTGVTSPELQVVHPGIYSLTISNEQGCSTTGTIIVKKDCYIDIPNAFTPDGDGINDYFFPRQLLSNKVNSFKMQIFNRWGQLTFETDSVNGHGWDGRYNGIVQPAGIYIYLVEILSHNSTREQYRGNVTLIR